MTAQDDNSAGEGETGGEKAEGARAPATPSARKTTSSGETSAGGKARASAGGKAKPSGGKAKSPGGKAKSGGKAKPGGRGKAAKAAEAAALWSKRAWILLLAVCAARLALNAITVIPVHFDEAQYWAYGREMALGHYSKPPLTGWLILAATSVLGDTLFALRAFAPLSHLAIGALIFLTARRLFDARTGFWAALVYTAAPGVSVSAHLMTTDPPMMAGWALALYGFARAMEVGAPPAKGRRKAAPPPAEPYLWWAVAGLGLGLGMLAKYTAIALPLGLIGYAIFSRQGPVSAARKRGALLCAVVALAVFSPNIWWNAVHGFVTVGHLGENAEVGRGGWVHPEKLLEFLGAQFGVIGPVAFPALVAALAALGWRAERADWRVRMLAWTAAPLLIAMCVQAILSEANANWAAPAYLGGSILAARWLLGRDWGALALKIQAGFGLAAVLAIWVLGGVYAVWATDLPRWGDPFKKMRNGGPFCEIALQAMEAEGAEALLSDDRRRLSECLFQGGMDFPDVAIWDPDGAPSNHFEFRSRLAPGDDRVMLLITQNEAEGAKIAAHFAFAQPIGAGEVRTHADRKLPYAVWVVEGFEGY